MMSRNEPVSISVLASHIDISMTCCQSIIQILKIILCQIYPAELDDNRLIRTPLLPTLIYFASLWLFSSQLILYSRTCFSNEWFILRAVRLSCKILGQGCVRKRLKSLLRSFIVDSGIASIIMNLAPPNVTWYCGTWIVFSKMNYTITSAFVHTQVSFINNACSFHRKYNFLLLETEISTIFLWWDHAVSPKLSTLDLANTEFCRQLHYHVTCTITRRRGKYGEKRMEVNVVYCFLRCWFYKYCK